MLLYDLHKYSFKEKDIKSVDMISNHIASQLEIAATKFKNIIDTSLSRIITKIRYIVKTARYHSKIMESILFFGVNKY